MFKIIEVAKIRNGKNIRNERAPETKTVQSSDITRLMNGIM